MKGLTLSTGHFWPAVSVALAGLLALGSGCAEEPEFRLNSIHKLTLEKEFLAGQEIPENQIEQLGNVMTALFGTPNDPHFPAGNEDLINPEHLAMAAGAPEINPGRASKGLYRMHCVHCHGVSGDGNGPTAASLNPYPRDFRLGKFKFKSTRLFRPPTDSDLKRILHRGIAGTSMPSFAMLNDEELNALTTYVKYLTIRGQVERALLAELANLEPDESLVSVGGSLPDEDYEFQLELVMEPVNRVLGRWKKAESQVVLVPQLPSDYQSNQGRYKFLGKQLFYGKANCVQCHGETGVGDGQTENYDDWTNEWLKRGNVDPDDPNEWQVYQTLGALKPRKIRPRNLRHRVFRGGNKPEDLFRRVRAGIEGTPMAASPNLSDREVWALVSFVRSSGYQHVEGPVETGE